LDILQTSCRHRFLCVFSYLKFVISFTQAGFFNSKVLHPKTMQNTHKLQQIPQKDVKYALICVQSGKFYTGQNFFTRAPPVVPVTNMRYVSSISSVSFFLLFLLFLLLVSFCWSIPPEFLWSFLALSGALFTWPNTSTQILDLNHYMTHVPRRTNSIFISSYNCQNRTCESEVPPQGFQGLRAQKL